MDHHPHTYTGLLATTSTWGFWMAVESIRAYGPSWATVPPLCIGLAGLIGAVSACLDGAQKRRHAEETHRAKLDSVIVAGLTFDQLEGRGGL